MTKKKIVIGAIILCVVTVIIYLITTADARYINNKNAYFEGAVNNGSIDLLLVEAFMNGYSDDRFIDVINSENFQSNMDKVFLCNTNDVIGFLEIMYKYPVTIPHLDEKVNKYFESNEFMSSLENTFNSSTTEAFGILKRLEQIGIKKQEIQDCITNSFNNLDIDNMIECYINLESSYYSERIMLDANTINSLANTAIIKNGQGGYYDGNHQKDYRKRIGIEGSRLFKAISYEYFGDFECVKSEGRDLNYYYEEEYYSSTSYYFRGNDIEELDNSFQNKDWYYTDKYLFRISSDGKIIECYELNKWLRWMKIK